MRALALLALAYGCSNGASSGANDASVVDADPCSASTAAVVVPGCVFDGLGQLSLDGAWSFTGTRQLAEGSAAQPYTTTYYLTRGSDACAFEVSAIAPPPDYTPHDIGVHYNDTQATYDQSGEYPHPHGTSWTLCVRESDNALAYHWHQYMSMPGEDTTIDGVLTR